MQSVMPPVLAIACVVLQVVAGRFSVTFSLLAFAAAALYVQGVRSFALASEIAHVDPVAPFLHPISGLLRWWLTLTAATHKLLGRSIEWRGRPAISPGRDR
jgi:uncharacterized membrane protein